MKEFYAKLIAKSETENVKSVTIDGTVSKCATHLDVETYLKREYPKHKVESLRFTEKKESKK